MAANDSGPAGAQKPPKKQRRGFVSWLWRGIFGVRSEDYEKRLQHLSKEEETVHARMKRRARSSRRMVRNLIVLSVIVEVAAVVYAIMTTRSSDLNWQTRAIRVLPMFVLPGLSSVIYSTLVSFTRMLDRKDQKTLERLRAERKAKIDELKEKTNYYTTQQIIQKYDLDPAAKAAAATVLASKLGADSGLKVYVGDEPKTNTPVARSEVDLLQSTGLRNRKQSHVRSNSTWSTGMLQMISETSTEFAGDGQDAVAQSQKVAQHYKAYRSNDGGWIARVASLLVGEDPSQCYALICGNCHMHNGLARKEDFLHITYYCPHCHSLNTSQESRGHDSGSSSSQDSSHAHGTLQGGEIINNMETVQELPVELGDEKGDEDNIQSSEH